MMNYKRPRWDSPGDDNRLNTLNNNKGKYLLVKAINNNFNNTNPIILNYKINDICGQVQQIKKVKDGLLIITNDEKQTKKVLDLKNICDVKVEVSIHPTLNYSKGIVFCRDLLNCEIQEILNETSKQGVVEIKPLFSFRNGEKVSNGAFVVTFNSLQLPKHLYVAMYSLPVREFIPNPVRCTKCQTFGHIANNCNKTISICICGKEPHAGNKCDTETLSCPNCSDNHPASSRNCRFFKYEYSIMEYKTKNRCSYFDAKRYIDSISTKPTKVSYANVSAIPVTSKNLINMDTNTIINSSH